MNGKTPAHDQTGIMVHTQKKSGKGKRSAVPTPRKESILSINSAMLAIINTTSKSITTLYILMYFDSSMCTCTPKIITKTTVGDKMKTKLTSWKNVNIVNKISICCVTIAHMRYIKRIIS